MAEPRIRIGDEVLTEAQAKALRVAVTTVQADMSVDEEKRQGVGEELANAYRDRLMEVLRIILRAPKHMKTR